jgi:small subunit ribosomal protein S20
VANSQQARKRVRQAEKHRQQNASVRSMLRTFRKQALAAINLKDKKLAETLFARLVKHLDRYATRKLLPKNRVARIKSQTNLLIKNTFAATKS